MFASGTIKTVTDKDGEIYINMLQLVDHLYNSAIVMRDAPEPDGYVIAQVLAMVAQELAKFGLFRSTIDDLEQVDSVDALFEIFGEE